MSQRWRSPIVAMCTCGLLLIPTACTRADDAAMRTKIADNIKSFQNDEAHTPATSVLKAMDAHLVTALQAATPETVKTPIPAAAGVQHIPAKSTLFVFWIADHPTISGLVFLHKSDDKSLKLPIPDDYNKENKLESDNGDLRMRITLNSDDTIPGLADILQHPSDYQVAIQLPDDKTSPAIDILEKTSPAPTTNP